MSSTSDPRLSPRLSLALDAARQAGQHTLRYFRRTELVVDRKADASPVTVADREAEILLRQRIAAAFPDDGILGEEFPERGGSSGYRWILDPIDGTKSFIHGVPLYGTLVGVEQGGRSTIGVIYIPTTDECVYAEAGHGAWYEAGSAPAERAKVSTCAKLAESLFVTSEVANFRAKERMDAYLRLDESCRLVRTWGDCFGYLLVATGRAELMVDPVMNIWDAAAIQPILEEAGGTFTDWQGERTIYNGEGIATNSLVLEEVLAITRKTSQN
jgi:histidinol phosphatase-like enzyme (inositol monophosphatase family)